MVQRVHAASEWCHAGALVFDSVRRASGMRVIDAHAHAIMMARKIPPPVETPFDDGMPSGHHAGMPSSSESVDEESGYCAARRGTGPPTLVR